ncbi:hypothetical protein C8J57DRAFT_1507730 [Mycena rebaudengoi]|nr:hypothetical protein C8J57DRAFT_1507730 [Mycena rebaudengoi]
MAWAKDRQGMRDREWACVMWSDECYIQLGDNKGRIYVTRTVDEVYDEGCLVPTFKQSPIRIMVRACIANNGKGPLVVLEYPGGKGGGMTAAHYQEQVLDAVVNAEMKRMEKKRRGMQFQQDGASSHAAKSTHHMNPIEPVWNDLKCIWTHRPCPSTFEELKSVVLAE